MPLKSARRAYFIHHLISIQDPLITSPSLLTTPLLDTLFPVSILFIVSLKTEILPILFTTIYLKGEGAHIVGFSKNTF